MDARTHQLLGLYAKLIDTKSVAVENILIGPFMEVCRDLHTTAFGGAYVHNEAGHIVGQYIYID